MRLRIGARRSRIELAIDVRVEVAFDVVAGHGSASMARSRLQHRQQPFAGARQPRHHGADRHADDRGDLLVATALRSRAARSPRGNRPAAARARRARARRCAAAAAAPPDRGVVGPFVAVVPSTGVVAWPRRSRRETRLYHVFRTIVNSQARASSSRKRRKEAHRAHARVLDDVLGVRVVPGQPPRVVERRVQVRQDRLLEQREPSILCKTRAPAVLFPGIVRVAGCRSLQADGTRRPTHPLLIHFPIALRHRRGGGRRRGRRSTRDARWHDGRPSSTCAPAPCSRSLAAVAGWRLAFAPAMGGDAAARMASDGSDASAPSRPPPRRWRRRAATASVAPGAWSTESALFGAAVARRRRRTSRWTAGLGRGLPAPVMEAFVTATE